MADDGFRVTSGTAGVLRPICFHLFSIVGIIGIF